MSDALAPAAPAPIVPAAATAPGGFDLSAAFSVAASLGKEGVEVIERLYAVAKDREALTARAAFHAAMAAFRAEMPHVLRTVEGAQKATRKGTRTVGMYAPLDSITAVLNPIIARHGLSYRFNREVSDGRDWIVCIVTHAAGHEEASRFPVKDDTTTGRNAIQAIASGESYAKRYALIAVFGITTADPDDDAQAAGGPPDNGEVIDAATAANIGAMLDEAPDRVNERKRFLAWIGAPTVEKIPAARGAEAVYKLDLKRKNGWKS